jgi:SAM-dependent methyltransferase
MAAEIDGELYERYRHGYPVAVLAAVGEALGLTYRDVVVDLGCGMGQVTLPIAGLVGGVIGVDPEPSMLITARRAAQRRKRATCLGSWGMIVTYQSWAECWASIDRRDHDRTGPALDGPSRPV